MKSETLREPEMTEMSNGTAVRVLSSAAGHTALVSRVGWLSSYQAMGATREEAVERALTFARDRESRRTPETDAEERAEREADLRRHCPSPHAPGDWWTCEVCGRKGAFVAPVYEAGRQVRQAWLKPSFWYVHEVAGVDVLHCRDCTWKGTVAYKERGEPPPCGWYSSPASEPIIEHPRS